MTPARRDKLPLSETRKKQGAKNQRHSTLCWTCQNAVAGKTHGCNWSRFNQPVEGWDALATVLESNQNSFRVKSCPEYLGDERKHK